MRTLVLLAMTTAMLADQGRWVRAKVLTVTAETRAACDDCQMRVQMLAPVAGVDEGESVLLVLEQAHNIPPGAEVRVQVQPAREGDSGAYLRAKVVRQ